MKIVPATAEMIEQMTGAKPCMSCRAFGVMEGDELFAVAGFYIQGTSIVMFSDMVDQMRKYPKVMLKLGRDIVKLARNTRIPVFSMADESIDASERFLEHLGFKRHMGNVFVLENK